MSLIKLEGVASTSAVSKAQKDAAVYMFGSKGHSIVAVLDKFARAKEIQAPHLAGILALMKDGADDEIIKFTSSAAGKKSIVAAKQFAIAKTFTNAIKYLKLIRVPMKWIPGHSDTAAARIQQTETIRASKRASTKPEKPIKLDNPHAPEAVEQEQTKASAAINKIWDLSKFKSNLLDSSWSALITAFNTEFKGRYVLKLNKREGAFRINTLNGGYSGRGEAFLSAAFENNSWVMFANDPATKSAAFDSWYVGPKLTFATIVSYLSNELAGPHSGEKQEIDKLIAGAVIFPHNDRYYDATEDQPKETAAKK